MKDKVNIPEYEKGEVLEWHGRTVRMCQVLEILFAVDASDRQAPHRHVGYAIIFESGGKAQVRNYDDRIRRMTNHLGIEIKVKEDTWKIDKNENVWVI